MLKTKDEIKKEIRDYLVDLPSKTKQVEEYTLSKISEIIQADTVKIKEAIEELKDNDLVDSRKVELDIYVPNTQDGFQVLADFAKKGYISFSAYWAVLFGVAVLFFAVLAFGNYLNMPEHIATPFEAFLTGIQYGIGGSFVVGLILGNFLQNELGKFRRWQILSEEVYKTISNILKYSIYIFVALGMSYVIASDQLGYLVDLNVIYAILGISVASAFSYEIITSRIKRKND